MKAWSAEETRNLVDQRFLHANKASAERKMNIRTLFSIRRKSYAAPFSVPGCDGTLGACEIGSLEA